MDPVQARELDDRLGVVVDAQVEHHVRQPGVAAVTFDDEERGRLLSPAVSAGGLCGGEAFQQPFPERPAGRRGERLGECVDRVAPDQDVPLSREARAGDAARPIHARPPREGRAAAGAVDHAELALVAVVVGCREALDDLLGAQPFAQQRQALGAVARVRVGLRRHGAHAGSRPRDDRADGQELRLGRHTPLSGLEITGGDRVGGDERLSHTSALAGRGRAGRDRRPARPRPRAARAPPAPRRRPRRAPRSVAPQRAPRAARRRRAPRARARPRCRSRSGVRSRAHVAPSPRTSAPSKPDRIPGLDPLDRGGRQLGEAIGGAGEQRERSPVTGDTARVAEQLERQRGLLRPHREVIADRQHGHARLVEPCDQRHVAEDARVAGEVDGVAVEAEHRACRLAGIRAVGCGGRVEGVRQRHAYVADRHRATLVERDDRVLGDAVLGEPVRELDHPEHLAAELLLQADDVACVVAVPMRDDDRIGALRLFLSVRARRSAQPRIDVEPLPAVRVDPERRMPEPRQCRHLSPCSRTA